MRRNEFLAPQNKTDSNARALAYRDAHDRLRKEERHNNTRLEELSRCSERQDDIARSDSKKRHSPETDDGFLSSSRVVDIGAKPSKLSKNSSTNKTDDISVYYDSSDDIEMDKNVPVDASRHDKFHGDPSNSAEPPTVTEKEQTCVSATDTVTNDVPHDVKDRSELSTSQDVQPPNINSSSSHASPPLCEDEVDFDLSDDSDDELAEL